MKCNVCAFVRQYATNWLLVLDLVLNTATGGFPKETCSTRIARARKAGKKWATVVCSVLTWVFNKLGQNRDHCTWCLQQHTSVGAEIIHFSEPDGMLNIEENQY